MKFQLRCWGRGLNVQVTASCPFELVEQIHQFVLNNQLKTASLDVVLETKDGESVGVAALRGPSYRWDLEDGEPERVLRSWNRIVEFYEN